ncbi:MAG TPA: hypothetical protein VGW38_11535 [Chloroflexota bacterium]|nr:hypothetical protein [Chloroflexota bacterium]
MPLRSMGLRLLVPSGHLHSSATPLAVLGKGARQPQRLSGFAHARILPGRTVPLATRAGTAPPQPIGERLPQLLAPPPDRLVAHHDPPLRQPSSLYRYHQLPGEVISHAVWLYYRFLLSQMLGFPD